MKFMGDPNHHSKFIGKPIAMVTRNPVHPEKPAPSTVHLSTQALRVLHRDKANTASGRMDEHLEKIPRKR